MPSPHRKDGRDTLILSKPPHSASQGRIGAIACILQPQLDAIIRRVKTSPLLIGEKDELALAVAAYFFSAAAAINRKSVPYNTREIADRIVELLRENPTLNLIETDRGSN